MYKNNIEEKVIRIPRNFENKKILIFRRNFIFIVYQLLLMVVGNKIKIRYHSTYRNKISLILLVLADVVFNVSIAINAFNVLEVVIFQHV